MRENERKGKGHMTKDKLRSVFQFYQQTLDIESQRRARFPSGNPHIGPRQFSVDEARTHFMLPPPNELAHFRFMCAEAQKFIDGDRVEKAMRWLGFLQGALWARGYYSLDDVRKHSMP